MLRWIFGQQAYTDLYHDALQALLDTWFTNGAFAAELAQVTALLDPYVAKDEAAFCSYDDWQSGVQALAQFCALRAESVAGQLDGSIPTTTEGQAADDSALVAANGLSISAMGGMGGAGGPGGSAPSFPGGEGGGMPSFPGGDSGNAPTPPDGESGGEASATPGDGMPGFPGEDSGDAPAFSGGKNGGTPSFPGGDGGEMPTPPSGENGGDMPSFPGEKGDEVPTFPGEENDNAPTPPGGVNNSDMPAAPDEAGQDAPWALLGLCLAVLLGGLAFAGLYRRR